MLNRFLISALILALVAGGGAGCSKQARKDRYLASAERDFQAGRYDRAEIEYLAVLKIPPPAPAAVIRLGELYYTDGRFLQALVYLQKGLELQPTNLDARLNLGLTFLAFGAQKEARDAALQVLQTQPENEQALLLLVDTTATTSQLKETLQRLEALSQRGKDKAGYHLARGGLYLRQTDLTNAESELKQAVAQDPKFSQAYLALGNLYAARGNITQAEPILKTAADLAPLRSSARLRYADFKFKTGALEEAKKAVTELTQKVPDFIPAWTFLAQAAFTERKRDECASLLEKILVRDPVCYNALVLRGDLMLDKGDGTNALNQFEHVAKTYGQGPQILYKLALAHLVNKHAYKSMAVLSQAIAANPDFADAILLLANLNIRRGAPDQAIASLTQLVQRQPQIPQAHLLLANAYLVQKNPDEAVAVYRRMLPVFPKSPDVPLMMGIVLAQQHKGNEARQAFEKSLERVPDYLPALEEIVAVDLLDKQFAVATGRVKKQIETNTKAAEPWLLMAKIHAAQANALAAAENAKLPASAPKLQPATMPAAQKDINQAEADLLKAIELNPALRNAYLLLAQLYVAWNKQQQALDRLNGLLAKTNVNEVVVVALMQVGMIQESLTNSPAARDAYEKLLNINPNFSPALNNLAYIYSERLVDLDKAHRLAEKARQLKPYDPSIEDILGWILYKRGEYTRALNLITESASKLPTDTGIQFHLGMTHYMLGEEEPARLALQRAVQGAKDFPGRDEAGRRLALLAIDVQTANAASISLLEQQLRQTPGDAIALDRLEAIQERDGALDKALQTCQTALKYNPQNPLVMLKLAQLYARLHDSLKALELAKNAHTLAPYNARISSLLGRLVFQNGDYKWAASLLEVSARNLPNDPEVSYDLAWSYYSLGRVPEAQTTMQKAVGAPVSLPASQIDDAKRFLAMVPAADDSVQAEKIVSQAEKILAANSNYVPAIFLSARVQEKHENYKEAAQLYDRALARYPLFAPAIRNLAILCCERLGDDQKAYNLALKARESFPDDSAVAKTLGVLAYRKGDYSRAAQFLKESAQTRKSDAELLYYLGMTQYQLKAKPESKAALQQALALNVPAKLADEARRILAELK